VIKGKWVIIAILGVAVVMGMATWPLLRIRRETEVKRTLRILQNLDSLCRQYESEKRRPPSTLDALELSPEYLLDAWRRPVQFRQPGLRNPTSWDLWSLGPLENDPSDDILHERKKHSGPAGVGAP